LETSRSDVSAINNNENQNLRRLGFEFNPSDAIIIVEQKRRNIVPPCCCATNPSKEGTSNYFSKYSDKYMRKFRKIGLESVQKMLLEGVRTEQVRDKEILDIGCGVGALHLTLLKEGAARATGVDISEGMIDHAKTFSTDLGVAERAAYVVGDFVDVAETIRESDVTLLDKLVCCYEDVDALVKASTAKTKNLYALSHPRQNFFTEVVFKSHIALARLFQWKFRPFWHDWKQLKENIQNLGFELVYSNATPMWQVLVFRRV
jgi:2-polyprenyl-3-methyl-5-hydroxy-6-metoxy-1,4-benzoquinol methylase